MRSWERSADHLYAAGSWQTVPSTMDYKTALCFYNANAPRDVSRSGKSLSKFFYRRAFPISDGSNPSWLVYVYPAPTVTIFVLQSRSSNNLVAMRILSVTYRTHSIKFNIVCSVRLGGGRRVRRLEKHRIARDCRMFPCLVRGRSVGSVDCHHDRLHRSRNQIHWEKAYRH